MRNKNQHTSRLNALLLLLATGFSLIASPAAAIAQEQTQRERRVNAPVTAIAPAAALNPGAPRTVEELRARVQEILRRPELAPAIVSVKIASLDTGRTVFEENAGKLLLPASVMKIYTVAAALERLTPDYRFKTSVYASAPPDASGTVRGDLVIYGRGDPSISTGFNQGDYFKAINELAASIVAAGVKRVEGDLIGDESFFTGPPYGFAWSWLDLQWYYGAEVSALTINNNALDLFVKPGASLGSPCSITTGPTTPLVKIVNRTTTTARGTKRDLTVYRPLGENTIEVSGSSPQDDQGYTGIVTISRPALLFVYMLRSALAERGVSITGNSRTINAPTSRERIADSRNGTPLVSFPLDPSQASSFARLTAAPSLQLVEIASRQSPPLSEIAAQTLKPSQNLYAELILRTLGRVAGTDPKLTSEAAGVEVVKAFLNTAGVDPRGVVMLDGSGLSRRDLVTASATVRLLTYMSKHKYATAFREALPVAGVDGTLSKRLKGTVAANNVRAKTGTIETVATLSGYVTSAAGERLVFAVMINNYPESSNARRTFIDEIAVLMASLAGKS
jgi:D-alanyl-D-alanine carboxypeptidase/D-alanyl-D-alanine-endopeptidase (penicillin-binding protein 4)